MTPEERQKAMEERLKNMTPEERAAFEQRRRERQAQGGGQGFGGGQGMGGGRGGNGQGGQNAGNFQRGTGQVGGSTRGQFQGQVASNNPGGSGLATTTATTIDALFAPIQVQETSGRAWLYINKQLKSVALRLGISDGTFTEVLNEPGELQPNTEVVTSVITPEMASRPANQQQQQNGQPNNPFNPQRGRPGGPGGGGRGGGR